MQVVLCHILPPFNLVRPPTRSSTPLPPSSAVNHLKEDEDYLASKRYISEKFFNMRISHPDMPGLHGGAGSMWQQAHGSADKAAGIGGEIGEHYLDLGDMGIKCDRDARNGTNLTHARRWTCTSLRRRYCSFAIYACVVSIACAPHSYPVCSSRTPAGQLVVDFVHSPRGITERQISEASRNNTPSGCGGKSSSPKMYMVPGCTLHCACTTLMAVCVVHEAKDGL